MMTTSRRRCERCRGTGTAIKVHKAGVGLEGRARPDVRESRCTAPECVEGWLVRLEAVRDPLL